MLSRYSLILASVLAPTASAQSLLYSIHGDSQGDQLGLGAANVGDVTGDGLPDFAVGSPGDSIRQVRLYRGHDGAYLASTSGVAQGDGFGSWIETIGDFDQNGVLDVLAVSLDGEYLRVLSGYGLATLAHWDIPDIHMAVPAGDVNGDGTPDVAVLLDPPLVDMELQVRSGLDGSVLWSQSDVGWLNAEGVGDLDGDGFDDLVVSDRYGSDELGVAHALSGLDGSFMYDMFGDEIWAWFGWELLALGDLDEDGFPDFLVSQPGDHLVGGNRKVHAFSGNTGQKIWTVTVGAYIYGWSLSAAGDFDGDGIPDFIATAVDGYPFEVYVQSGKTGEILFGLPFDGWVHTGLGDVDGNGTQELLVGNYALPDQASSIGEAQIFSGPCPTPHAYCDATGNSAGPNGARIGFVGSSSYAANDLTLTVQGGPPGALGVFIYGTHSQKTLVGDGYLCISNQGSGVVRLLPGVGFDAGGFVERSLDNTQAPFDVGAGALSAGMTGHFQLWYRDPPAGVTGTNFSDALIVTYCP